MHEWYTHVSESKCPGIKTFKKTAKEREEDLLNYYETFVTNAQAENFHSHVKRQKRRLSDSPDIKITALALELGFNDHSAFAKVFRQIVGKPRQSYRDSI